jgi:protein involved in polysaccharide export with SLBB domain
MALLATIACLGASLLAGQQPDGPALATRERLGTELARLEHDGGAGARARATLIRARLANGDFQQGDRILIRVDGEPQLSDTFTVAPGPALALPQLGSIALAGVLRSELKDRLETHLAHYLRDPVVQVQPLIRILVEGDVARPGFYAAAPQQPLSDLITAAGGFTQRAKSSGILVERGSDRIWSGEPLQQALGRGYSLDQLSLQAGDRLLVPTRGDGERAWRIVGLVISLPIALYSLTRIAR